MRTSRRSIPGLSVLLVGALALSACGSSNSTSASGSGSSSSSQDAARVKFAQCLRDHGVNVPDSGGPGAGGALRNVDRTKLQAATKACAKFQRGAFGNVSPAQRQQFQDAFVKFSSCMRSHGVNVPTPTSGGGGPPAGGQIDQNDPKVKAATKACQSKLPRGGAAPGGN